MRVLIGVLEICRINSHEIKDNNLQNNLENCNNIIDHV